MLGSRERIINDETWGQITLGVEEGRGGRNGLDNDMESEGNEN